MLLRIVYLRNWVRRRSCSSTSQSAQRDITRMMLLQVAVVRSKNRISMKRLRKNLSNTEDVHMSIFHLHTVAELYLCRCCLTKKMQNLCFAHLRLDDRKQVRNLPAQNYFIHRQYNVPSTINSRSQTSEVRSITYQCLFGRHLKQIWFGALSAS